MKIEQEYEVVPIGSIKPHPDNPNRGDVEMIRESIQSNTWYGVITVQRSRKRILAGEHRWRAAKAEGATEVPVVWKDVDDTEALRIMLIDNESARQGVLDPTVQKKVLEKLAKIDEDALVGTGFTLSDLEYLQEQEEAEPDEAEIGVLEAGDDEPLETQYGIIVMVSGEERQKEAYEALSREYGSENIRVVSV